MNTAKRFHQKTVFTSENGSLQNNRMTRQKSPIKILVVEDNTIIQKVTMLTLRNAGYSVELARTGQEALWMAKNNYHAILLDLGLPDISGIEVSRYIRQQLGNKHVPIIAYTAQSSFIRSECFDAGINDVLTKPCDPDYLCKKIENLLDFFHSECTLISVELR